MEIINKVANKNIKQIDLEDCYPQGKRFVFDISSWLYKKLILREKDFREYAKNYDWSKHQDDYIALQCSSEAIIPSWAYSLLTTKLQPFAKKIVIGNLELLETIIFYEIIESLDISTFKNERVIIKGCANKPIPPSAYSFLISKLQPVAKSIMFGEACSMVPLYKR